MKLFKLLSTTLFTALMVFGLTTKADKINTLEVFDVLEENVSKDVTGKVIRRVTDEVPANKVSAAKAQVTGAKNGKRDIRFVVGLDSYKYEAAKFDIVIKDGANVVRTYPNQAITKVYQGLIANGKVKTASEIFGEEYNYLMAFTVKQIPASAWNYTFEVSSSLRQVDSSTWTTSEVVNKEIASMAAIDENPVITYDESCGIYTGSLDDILDNDTSTYVWFEGTPSYVDFNLPKETLVTSLDIAFANQYGYASLAAPTTVSYKDANGDFVTLGNVAFNNFNLEFNGNVTSFTTDTIRLSGNQGAWTSITEFSYNYKDELEYELSFNGVGGIYHGSPLALFDGNSANNNSIMMLNAAPSVNGYIDIDLRKDTKLESLSLVTYSAISGMPRVQYRAENDSEFVTLADYAIAGLKMDLRNRDITARYIRLTTTQDQTYDQWINYKEIVINGLSKDTPTLHLEGSSTSIYQGDIYNVFDGDDSTYIWNNFATLAGDAYVFTYNTPFTLKNLYVYYRTGYPEEICKYDSIAYKVAGDNEWHDIDFEFPAEQNALFLALENEIENVIQIKLYSSIDLGGVWSGLATFETNLDASFSEGLSTEYTLAPTEGIKEGNTNTFLTKVFDKNDATYYCFASAVGAQDYLVIDLGSVKHINAINILFQHWDANSESYFKSIEYSVDGVNWSSSIACSTNSMNHVFSNTAHARYFRFSGEYYAWPAVASINFTAAY